MIKTHPEDECFYDSNKTNDKTFSQVAVKRDLPVQVVTESPLVFCPREGKAGEGNCFRGTPAVALLPVNRILKSL
jgi:hypothetical protein